MRMIPRLAQVDEQLFQAMNDVESFRNLANRYAKAAQHEINVSRQRRDMTMSMADTRRLQQLMYRENQLITQRDRIEQEINRDLILSANLAAKLSRMYAAQLSQIRTTRAAEKTELKRTQNAEALLNRVFKSELTAASTTR